MGTFFTRIKDIFNNKSLHSFLLCVFVVLYYYNEVEAMCSIIQPITCVIVLLSLIWLCTKLIKYFDYDILVSSIILTFWTFIFFFTMHLLHSIKSLIFIDVIRVNVVFFIFLMLFGLLINFLLIKKRNTVPFFRINQYLNVLFLLLISFEFTKSIFFLKQKHPYITSIQTESSAGKYNLFILIIDGYARADNLKKYWNYNNETFLNFLKQKKFFLVDKSKSNYCGSEQTVGSMLLLNYLSNSQNPLYKSRQTFNNPLCKLAFKKGYSVYNLGLFPISDVESNYTSDHFIVKNLYHYILLNTPVYGYFNFSAQVAVANKSRVKADIDIFEKLPNIFKKHGEKKIVLSHSLLTHTPYDKIDSASFRNFFSYKTLSDTLSWFQYESQKIPQQQPEFCRDCYLNQLKISNNLVLQTLDSNWDSIKTNSVILVMSDHGFRFLDKRIPPLPSNKEAYENFAAIYFPDKDYITLNDTMTILNSARMCVNKALGTKLSYIKDTSNLK